MTTGHIWSCQSYYQMINDQLSRILSSRPESLMIAVEQNNQGLSHLELILEERGRQVLSLQTMLTGEMGLLHKVLHAKDKLAAFMRAITEISSEMKVFKDQVKNQIKTSKTELIFQIAKVFKQLCVDKKAREEENSQLRERVAQLMEEIKLRSSGILHLDKEDSLQQSMRDCQVPVIDNVGYTLGSSALKELFAPSRQLLDLTTIQNLKQVDYQGSVNKGEKQGKGTCYYDDGCVYKGMFKSGARHGFGQLLQDDVVVYRGDWKKDTFWGKGTLHMSGFQTQYQNAILYMGNFQSGHMHGLGVLQFSDGTRLTTEFNKGKVVAPGILSRNQQMSIMSQQRWALGDSQTVCR